MRVAYFYADSKWWARVHREDCADLVREARQHGQERGTPASICHVDASSEREVIEDAAGDFIFANDRTPWTDYIGQVSFAPCIKLPSDYVPIEVR